MTTQLRCFEGRQYQEQTWADIHFVNHFLSHYAVLYPNICTMMKILLAASPSTRPLEWAYSKSSTRLVLRASKHYAVAALKESKISYERARLISFYLKYIVDFVNSFFVSFLFSSWDAQCIKMKSLCQWLFFKQIANQ